MQNVDMKTPVKPTDKDKAVFQFKITLNDSSPRVWRRISVPRTYSFFDLHTAIQSAMGWLDSHLHGFRIAQKGTARPVFIQFPHPEDDEWDRQELLDERKEKITDYFGKSIKQCVYEYDFGDGWEHTVLLEQEFPAEPDTRYPQCIGGKNACPPDDCGGLGGYDRLQEILKNPKHPEHKEILEWLGIEDLSEFDPTYFDASEIEFEDPRELLKKYEERFKI